jgi:hypothetical protein
MPEPTGQIPSLGRDIEQPAVQGRQISRRMNASPAAVGENYACRGASGLKEMSKVIEARSAPAQNRPLFRRAPANRWGARGGFSPSHP